MLRRALFASLTIGLAGLAAASLAYEIKPKNSEFRLHGKSAP